VNAAVIVLDSGVIGEATSNGAFREAIRELIDLGWTPVVPTVVLAECVTGRASDAPTNQAIARFNTTDTDKAMARRAGILRFRAQRASGQRMPSGIDAIVAAHAAAAATAVVFTTDPTDLRRLLVDFPNIRVEKP